MKKVIVILAEGFEEVEALTPVDLLRREGVDVVIAGLGGKEITSSHGIKLYADKELSLEDVCKDWSAVILPGGMPGSKNLHNSKLVNELIQNSHSNGALICAICAAPALVLAPLGILNGKKVVCYPGMEEGVEGAVFGTEKVVRDKNIITSRGAGCAVDFGLEIVSALFDSKTAERLAAKIVF